MNEYEIENNWKCSRLTQIFRFVWRLFFSDWIHEQDRKVAGDTADIETGQILILERCLCHIAFCIYKSLNIGLYHNSALLYMSRLMSRNDFLHADSGLFLHPAT